MPDLADVARAFQDKGYKLADPLLVTSNDEISKLDFVLGNSDAHVMPQAGKLFGSNVPSMYSQTPAGIMLL